MQAPQQMPQRQKILVVDDDLRLRDLLKRYLAEQGFAVDTVPDAPSMDRSLQRVRYDLIVLDLMLPGEDGLAICRRLRAGANAVAVIMLTAKGDDVDRILGLEMGADDYLAKPFNPRELVARIHAVLRRQAPAATPGAPTQEQKTVEFGPFALQLANRALTRDGEADRAHHRRVRAAEGARPAPARADVARQADGARARPRARELRPLHRRAGLAPEEAAGRGSAGSRASSRPCGASATCSSRKARRRSEALPRLAPVAHAAGDDRGTGALPGRRALPAARVRDAAPPRGRASASS